MIIFSDPLFPVVNLDFEWVNMIEKLEYEWKHCMYNFNIEIIGFFNALQNCVALLYNDISASQ